MTHRRINTHLELDELPVDAAVVDDSGIVFQSYADGMWSGDGRQWATCQIVVPAFLIWGPDRASVDE